VVTLVSVGETVAGFEIAHNTRMSEGKADVIRYMGIFGIMQGAALTAVVSSNPSVALFSSLSLLGSAAGYAVGTAMTNGQPYNRGNASVLGTAGLLGAFIPTAMTASALAYENGEAVPKALGASIMLGNAAGLYFGNSLLKNKHYSTAEGNYVILSTAAGFLVGLGAGEIIASGSSSNSPWGLTVPMVLGSAAGFGIMLATLGNGSGRSTGGGWDVNFNPGAVMGALLPQKGHSTNINAYVPPALGVSYHW
jgi:hypothetical protein